MRSPNIYRAEMWESQDGGGVSDTRHVTLKGYAKLNSAAVPNCVVNEYIASRIGGLLGLPVPPGALIEGPPGAGVLAWVALTFAKGGIRLPPVNGAEVARDVPELAAEVAVFDMLIANSDRHAGNLAYMSGEHRLEVFDHSHAILGPSEPGIAVFRGMLGSLVIDGRSGGNRHCLIDHLANPDHLVAAIDAALASARDGAIMRICEEASLLNLLAKDDAILLGAMLIDRRNRLKDLLRDNKDQFTAIGADSWGLL